MFYRLTSGEEGTTLTFANDEGDTNSITEDHPHWERIRDGIISGEMSAEEASSLLNVSGAAADRLRSLSERVTFEGRTIYFDGDPVRNEIANHIVRLLQEDKQREWTALVNFLEKVQTNPSEHSRESLYSWINNRDITLTKDGDLVAYKGVKVVDGDSFSISHGTAYVDGVKHQGAIPNPQGGVIEMPRSQVQHNPSVGCSTGLHAGTWEYASGFAQGRVLTVKINPRDVVSVPTDCNAQKVRVSRYEVMSEVDVAFEGTTWEDDDEDFDELEDEWWTSGTEAAEGEDWWDDETEEEEDDTHFPGRFPEGETVVVSTVFPTYKGDEGSPVLIEDLSVGDSGEVIDIADDGDLYVKFIDRDAMWISQECIIPEDEVAFGLEDDDLGTPPMFS